MQDGLVTNGDLWWVRSTPAGIEPNELVVTIN